MDARIQFICITLTCIAFANSLQVPESLKSNKITDIGENWSPVFNRVKEHSRSKRWTIPSEAEKKYILDLHNNYRRQEGASNMEFMQWNDVLSDMAGAWGDLCRWEHGQPTGYNPPYSSLGQNLYIINNRFLNHSEVMRRGMKAFYDEKVFWTFDTSDCVEGEMCGHYTQVVWAESYELGCAISLCEQVPLNLPSHFANSLYLVCNYGPPGNIELQSTGKLRQPYKVGPACTECNSGNFWCDNGLCRTKEKCDNAGANCECKAVCQNCGTVNSNTCSCSCAKGFTGVDCSADCVDTHEYCGANPGWPQFWCEDSNYPYVKELCPKLCGVCEALSPGETPPTCVSTTPSTTSTSSSTTSSTTSSTSSTTSTTTPSTTTSTSTSASSTASTTSSTPSSTIPSSTTTTTSSTSSSSTTPSTSTTTTLAVDCAGYCRNGGVPSVTNDNQCQCACVTGWQGPSCEESTEEARVGLKITVYASQQVWDIMWTSYLLPSLVSAVNFWCNSNVPSCCPGAAMQISDMFYQFSTANEIVVGQGYPKEYSFGNGWRTEALLYAYGAPQNDLCANSQDTVAMVSRKKRATMPDMTLSQETFQLIVQGASENITEMLRECCNITVVSIERATVDDSNTETDDQQKLFGLALWIWIVIGVGVVTFILLTLIIAICCCCMKKSSPSSDKYKSTEDGYNNQAYVNYNQKH